MDIRNVYIVSGYINDKGIYENTNDISTFIAECKLYDEEGFSYYSFLNYDNNAKSFIDNKLIRLEKIMPLIESKDIIINKLNVQQLDRFKEYFSAILEKSSENLNIKEGKYK